MEQAKPEIDLEDEPIWRFFGALAVGADSSEQELLVTNVKDKVFEFTTFTKKSWITEDIIQLKIVSFLSSLSLKLEMDTDAF